MIVSLVEILFWQVIETRFTFHTVLEGTGGSEIIASIEGLYTEGKGIDLEKLWNSTANPLVKGNQPSIVIQPSLTPC